jgi:predicted MFS family arabinose efflux permease
MAIPVAIATAAGYGALIMLFTDEARGNEGEILGVTASINALGFGITSLTGGLIASASPAGPLVLASVLMALATLLLFRNPKPKPTT